MTKTNTKKSKMGGVAKKMARNKMVAPSIGAFRSNGLLEAERTGSFSAERRTGAIEGNAARALPSDLHRIADTRPNSEGAVGRSDRGRTASSHPAGWSAPFLKLLIESSRTANMRHIDQSHQVVPSTEHLMEKNDKRQSTARGDGSPAAFIVKGKNLQAVPSTEFLTSRTDQGLLMTTVRRLHR